MFMSGEYAVEYIRQRDGSRVPDQDIQTHGIELGIEEIYRLDGTAFIGENGYQKQPRTKVSTNDKSLFGDEETEHLDDPAEKSLKSPHYTLQKGNYVVEYDKKVTIPEKMVGFVFPRSRLMRSGLHVTSAVWECGYEGIGEGGLYVDNQVVIHQNARIAQIILARAEVFKKYSGSHQNENLEDE